MKKFIKKSAGFLIILIIILIGIDILSMVSPINKYIAKMTNSSINRDGSAEIEARIEWVSHKDKSKFLVVGDSVANQLSINFREKNNDYCIATSNASITMLGQYILICEYIEKHNDVKDIYMIVMPQTLDSDINTRLSYQYVVMPFIGNGYGDYLSDNTYKQLENTFGSIFLQPIVIRAIDFSCINRKIYLNSINSEEVKKDRSTEIPDITKEYLTKIYDICKENDINFYLIPAPVADTLQRHNEIADLEQRFEKAGLNILFPDFFEQVQYYPKEQFRDGTHFESEYINDDFFNKKILDMHKK